MTRSTTIDDILHPAHAAAQELSQIDAQLSFIDAMLARISASKSAAPATSPAIRKYKAPYTVAGRSCSYHSEYAAIVAARAAGAVVTDAEGSIVWQPAALTQLQRDIARTDTVMLHSLRAGFLRVGTDECLASAEVIAAEIARRTDASCEAWARNLRLPIDGRRTGVSDEQQRDAQFNRQQAKTRGAL